MSDLLMFELLNISTFVYVSKMFASKCSNKNKDHKGYQQYKGDYLDYNLLA